MELGVKSVSMQDVAAATGTSKTSLYDSFSTKQELVDAVINYDFEFVTQNLDRIQKNSSNAIDELLQMSEFIIKRFGQCNPCLLFDLKKYYATSWEKFMQLKQAFMNQHILTNLQRGQAENLYRKDFDEEIISRIYFSKMEAFFDDQVFPQSRFHFVMVHKEYIIYHLRGIASKKGHEILDISLSLKNRIA